jgi:hypothetical protein
MPPPAARGAGRGRALWTRPAAPLPPGAPFEATIRVPSRHLLAVPPVKADRTALAAGLRDNALPAACVALVGDGAHGPAWVAGGRLAGLVPASEYFGG